MNGPRAQESSRPRGRNPGSQVGRARLARALRLTRLGMLAESALRAFWPLFSLILALLAALMMGALRPIAAISEDAVTASAALAGLALAIAAGFGIFRMRWPRRADAEARLDSKLQGRPLQALKDRQATRAADAATNALWDAHLERMVRRAEAATPVKPNLQLSRRDPFALRLTAVLAFAVALVFGAADGVGTAESEGEGGPGTGVPVEASWEGWIEPPRYTGLPTLYLNEIAESALDVPAGSLVTVRLYGDPGALAVHETVSGRALPRASSDAGDFGGEVDANGSAAETDGADQAVDSGDAEATGLADLARSFAVERDGTLRVDGPGGREWGISVIPDLPPTIERVGALVTEISGPVNLAYRAADDYGVEDARVEIDLDLDAVDRKYGLELDPEPAPDLDASLPLPIAGGRVEFEETFREDYSRHPWAHLPVAIVLSAEDALGQVGTTETLRVELPARRFFDPVAAAVAEQRRDLLWNRDNATRVSRVIRAFTHRPDGLFRSPAAYLRLRTALRQLEAFSSDGLDDAERDEIAEALWDIAILLEDGDIADALERLRAAQERLAEAMRNGATDEEIARLMQELRQATEDYMRQLAQQAREPGREGQDSAREQSGNGQTIELTQSDIERMMERIQELMEQGRFAEAEQALEEFRRMMENMRMAQGGGQGQRSPGQQAMEGLAETLREQQGLSDEAFRSLQEQFNPDASQGQSSGNEGQSGGLGRGESHDGQGRPGQQGQGDGRDGQASEGEPGQGRERSADGEGNEPGLGETLADRQRDLRQELDRQRRNLPGAGTEGGDAAREALDRAGRAMDGAEDALRRDDYAGAIDQQSQALDALREGIQELGDQLAEEQGQPGQGDDVGDANGISRDPLGRNRRSDGRIDSGERLLQGDDVYRRARDLLDEIRRRSGEGARPETERSYLRRLLERF